MRGSNVALGLGLAGVGYLGYRMLVARAATDLQGLIAFVTGGSRGLGLCLARELAQAGCRVAIAARDPRELEAAVQDFEGRGVEVLALVGDLGHEETAAGMIRQVVAHFGGLDLLVLNAGEQVVAPLEDLTSEDFVRAWHHNLLTAVYPTLAALPLMQARGQGTLVYLDSLAGRVPAPHMLPYAVAKAGLRALAHGLVVELAGRGIEVLTVVPGFLRTGANAHTRFGGQAHREFTWFSLAESLPGLSLDAERAARRIVQAIRHRERELTLGAWAAALGWLHDDFPRSTLAGLGLVARMLPGPGGGGTARQLGLELATPLAPGWLTRMNNEAAVRLNQYGGSHEPSAAHALQVGLGDEADSP